MAKLKIVRKWQKMGLYKKSLILYTLLLFILAGIILVYVYNSMVLYERNLVDNYISYLATTDKLTKNVSDDLFVISPYEKAGVKISDGIKKLYNSDDLKIKKNAKLSQDGIYAYDLYNKEKLISTVSIESVNSYKRMGILKIDEWNVVDYQNYFDKGIYAYEIKVPSNYTVKVNGKELESSMVVKESDVDGLERLTEYVEIEKSKTYEVNNLVYKPEIEILDEKGQKVSYQDSDGKIVISREYKEIKTLEEAQKYLKDNFDVLKLAENWSLYLTNDLVGGLNTLSNYLIKDSYYYTMAYNWSRNVDRTFVSSHRLKNPVFTNETVSDFIFYNDNAFSCKVYLEKNMVVSGNDKQDIMNDRLYFVYYDGGYKLVNMEAIKK